MSWTLHLNTNSTVQSVPFPMVYIPMQLSLDKLSQKAQTDVGEPPKGQGFKINLTVEQLQNAGYQVNKKPWTEEEDQRLTDLFTTQDLSWKQIAEKMPGRTSKMCYSRYRRIENKLKQQWTQRQDIKIQGLVGLLGEDWERISQFFPKRNSKQIQDHYLNYLRPEINKEPWTLEEDLHLIKLLEVYGKNWSYIEKQMNGRTQSQIKNRYFGRLKRMQEKKEKESKQEIQNKEINTID